MANNRGPDTILSAIKSVDDARYLASLVAHVPEERLHCLNCEQPALKTLAAAISAVLPIYPCRDKEYDFVYYDDEDTHVGVHMIDVTCKGEVHLH